MMPLEDAQIRVAKAQEEKDKLAAEVTKKFGALRDLDVMCQHHNDPHGKNSELRRKYNAAVKELRLAKSDLARMRNEEQQKTKLVVPPPSNAFEEKLIEVSREQGIEVEIKDRPAYMEAMDQAADKAEAERIVFSSDARKNAEIRERSEGRKKVQMDLEGNRAKAVLSGRIKIPPQRFELETPTWVLKGPKEAMLELVNSNQRPAVKAKVQKGLRAKKDAMINDGDFDQAVERFTDEIMRGIIHRLPEDD